MADVVRVRYTLPDRADFPQTWPALRKWFTDAKPAATMIQAGLMEEAMKIEIEVTAVRRGPGGPAPAGHQGHGGDTRRPGAVEATEEDV